MNKIIIFVDDNRHTDVVIKVFPFSDENLEKVKELCKKCYPGGDELNYEGDYDFGYDDSTHAWLKVTEMSNI
jgi:hypothetical protein